MASLMDITTVKTQITSRRMIGDYGNFPRVKINNKTLRTNCNVGENTSVSKSV